MRLAATIAAFCSACMLVGASTLDHSELVKRIAHLPLALQKIHLARSTEGLTPRELQRRENCMLACLDTDCSICSDQACVASCDANCPICCAIHDDNCYYCATDYDCRNS